MGNKQYYVSKDNGLEKLKQDVNERFGNLFGGNYSLKHEISNFLSFEVGQSLAEPTLVYDCFVTDNKISLMDSLKTKEYSIYFDGTSLGLYCQESKNESKSAELIKIQDQMVSGSGDGLLVSKAHGLVTISESKDSYINRGSVSFQQFDKNGLEIKSEFVNLKDLKTPLFGKTINSLNVPYKPFEIQNLGRTSDNIIFASERTIKSRETVDTMGVIYENYETGQKFSGEIPIDERYIETLQNQLFDMPQNQDYLLKPIMPESMEEIERKIANAPTELQEALRQMAPNRVNYYNNEIPVFEDPSRGVAR